MTFSLNATGRVPLADGSPPHLWSLMAVVAVQEHPGTEPMTIKMTPGVVPDATRFNPVLPIDGIVAGHIWTGIVEGVVPTYTHFMYDEKGREGCMLIRYVEGNSIAMVRTIEYRHSNDQCNRLVWIS